jgi:hypothetical protein
MKVTASVIALLAAFTTTDVSAQEVNLTGRWLCVAQCVGTPGSFAFITQNRWEMNMVNETGQSSRAWVNYPGRIWVDRANQGAIYSPDGLTIQFDRGEIWQRAPELPPPPPLLLPSPPPPPRRR